MKNNIIDIRRTSTGNPLLVVTLAEAKAQCIVTYTDDDTLITSLITKAIKHVENYCNISILAQTVILTADLYNEWELPYGPVTGIQSVKTRAANEGSGPQTYNTATSGWGYDGEEFLTFIPSEFGQFDVNAPYTGNPTYPYPNRYRIQYTAGYTAVPDDLKQAVLLQIAWLYEHRGDEEASKYDWTPGVCAAALKFADAYKRQSWL